MVLFSGGGWMRVGVECMFPFPSLVRPLHRPVAGVSTARSRSPAFPYIEFSNFFILLDLYIPEADSYYQPTNHNASWHLQAPRPSGVWSRHVRPERRTAAATAAAGRIWAEQQRQNFRRRNQIFDISTFIGLDFYESGFSFEFGGSIWRWLYTATSLVLRHSFTWRCTTMNDDDPTSSEQPGENGGGVCSPINYRAQRDARSDFRKRHSQHVHMGQLAIPFGKGRGE